MKVTNAATVLATALIAGCATQLTPEAEKLRLVNGSDKSRCESLGLVTADQSLGPSKQANAMAKVQNEVARRGGNAMFMAAIGNSGFDGVAVTAEALRCPS